VTADYESGDGRHDILVKRKKGQGPNVVMEIKRPKAGEKDDEQALRELAEDALKQIKDKDYAHGLEGPVVAYGVAFASKRPLVLSEKLK